MEVMRQSRETHSLLVQFQIVPAYDLLISLAAAARPVEHDMPTAWARQVRSCLPAEQRRDLNYFFGGPAPFGTRPMQLVPDVPDGGPRALADRIGSLSPADLLAVLVGRASERAVAGAVRRTVRSRATPEDDRLLAQFAGGLKAEARRRFRSMMDSPVESSARYVALVRAHLDSWFATEYDAMTPILEQRARQGRRSIGKLPTTEVIARITGGFTLGSPAARSVMLVPSYYASPFVYLVRDGRDVVVVYGARPAQTDVRSGVNTQTVRVLKALADETRLRILQLLTQRPLYGQQLAAALGVRHPTVSHHMAQLRIAGLTRTELAEDGNQTYSVRPEALEDLFSELRTAFIEPVVLREGEK